MKSKSKIPETKSKNRILFYIIIALAAFAVYANSLSNEFVFDDESVVQGDPSITSLSNLPAFFSGQQGFHKVIGRYYRPVVSASYTIDCSLYGLKPLGFHFTNVLIHVINSLLFFYLLTLMFTGTETKCKNYAILLVPLGIGAVLFAVHPIHTEAVAWVSGRTDSLCFTFFAAAFILYLKYSDSNKILHLCLCFFLYIFALLTKEMAITLPVVIILYDFIFKGLRSKEKLVPKINIYILFAVVSVLYMVWRWYVLKDSSERITYMYFYGKDSMTALFTMLQTLPLYFRLSVIPYGMLYHYSNYLPYQTTIFNFIVIFSIVFIVIVLFSAIYLFKRLPGVSYAIFFFFITLIPVLNIVPTMNFMADRFLYIPSAMLSIIFVSLILRYYSEKNKNIIYTVCAVFIVVYSYLTIARNADWKTNDSLFLSADGKPGSVTYVNIGNIYANKQDYTTAEKYYRMAIDLRPETVLANDNLGKIFLVRNNFDSAYYYMYKAYTLDTLSPEPMYSLAMVLANNNKYSESLAWLEKIQTITPGYMESVKMIGQLQEEIKNQNPPTPTSKSGDNNNVENPQKNAKDDSTKQKLAELEQQSYQLYQQKDYDGAIKMLKELVKQNPEGSSGYYNNIGMCYLDNNKLEDAKKSFILSIEGNKKFSTAYNNLGTVYKRMGDKTKAKENFTKAIEADPNNQDAKNNLEELLR